MVDTAHLDHCDAPFGSPYNGTDLRRAAWHLV
jgi:hypothetical protein